MCELCGTEEERERGREQCRLLAQRLERLADNLYALAGGMLKPHSQDTKSMMGLAHEIIISLVNEYL